MIIKKFSATDFRNIKSCKLELFPGINLLHGRNAQGKTNALEGIYLFSRGKSFRAREDGDMKRFGTEGFHIAIEYEDSTGDATLEYSYFGKDRVRKKNGYKLKSVSEMIGSFRSVLFYPDNLEIVKGGPEERRSFINVAISQCYPSYIKYYSDYKKALENRNCLLKLMGKGLFVSPDELESWSYSMADYASYIYLMREEYLARLTPKAVKIAGEISGGSEALSITHECEIDTGITSRSEVRDRYVALLNSAPDRERGAGVTLFGPHRDDIKLSINGNDSRLYASQGQQRSVVLALKLGEGEVIKELTGEYPVYLFDDVLSELDEGRRKFVLSELSDRQMIITSCESEEYEKYGAKIIEVSEGEYVSAHR